MHFETISFFGFFSHFHILNIQTECYEHSKSVLNEDRRETVDRRSNIGDTFNTDYVHPLNVMIHDIIMIAAILEKVNNSLPAHLAPSTTLRNEKQRKNNFPTEKSKMTKRIIKEGSEHVNVTFRRSKKKPIN